MSAEANENADQNTGDGAFGQRPDERVYEPRKYPRRPDVRTRVAPMAGTGGLEFEPEIDGQEQALAALLAPPPAPQSGLAFEPEEGGALDRLSARPSVKPSARPSVRAVSQNAPAGPAGVAGPVGPANPAEEDIASLLALAGERDVAGALPAKPAIPPPLDAAAGQAAFRGRPATTGDIEAELFGPGSARFAARPDPAPGAAGPPPGGALAEASVSDDVPPPTQSVASVFLSERVLGRRRKRKTTGLLRRSGQLRAVADKWLNRIYSRTKRSLRAVDRVTGKARLPLANIFWAAAIAALSLAFGLALPFAGGVLAAGLILTIAGQPARNLIGIAGIMILSASLAEVVRQRERFIEIFLDIFG